MNLCKPRTWLDNLPFSIHQQARLLIRWLNRLLSGKCNLLGDRDIEWSWIASQMPEGPGDALDFGPGNSCLGLVGALRGFRVIAIDLEDLQRPYQHPDLRYLKSDILDTRFPENQFDLVINCSTVEHVGLKDRFGVTVPEEDGDLDAMNHLIKVMKPSGVMLLTIPVGKDANYGPLHRVYGNWTLPRLLAGYHIEKEEFWIKDKKNRWVESDKESALGFQPSVSYLYPPRCSYALGCFVLRAIVQK